MKTLFIALSLLLCCTASAADTTVPATAHRYMIERTFPKGALDHLDTQAKQSVNATNSKFGVTWITSYANADKTKTFCVYEGPDESAIRKAAAANKIPVDSITEIPVTLDSK
jgi:hypothetical protein